MFIRNNRRFNIYASQTIDGVTYPSFTDPSLRTELGITEIEDPTPPTEYLEHPEFYFKIEQDDEPYVVYTRKDDATIADIVFASVVEQTQARLDGFARTRNYDSILSACTYATSSIPKFAAEGQYCVDARDATWNALYTILGQVQSNQRPLPNSFAEIEPELPTLQWPV